MGVYGKLYQKFAVQQESVTENFQQTAAVLKIPAEGIVQKVEDLTAQVKKLQKDVQNRARQSAVSNKISVNGGVNIK